MLSALGGCGSGAGANTAHAGRLALQSYLREVEPLRLAVNQLLTEADPTLGAVHDGRISAATAARRIGRLERHFADYTVDIAAIQPATPALRALHAIYAHTYIFEDAYLSALANGLAERRLDSLPNTQPAQRAAIIQWRTGLTVLARDAGVVLPGDLQQAGRGEIAPSPIGS